MAKENKIQTQIQTPVATHPLQPLVDDAGTTRFKANEIVRYLLDNGRDDMNTLAALPFSQEDREQFAQLIGYSLGGFGELPYVSEETWQRASSRRVRRTVKQVAKPQGEGGIIMKIKK